MLKYYFKNGIHHFTDEEEYFSGNGGWTSEYFGHTYYSVHTKRAEYLMSKGDDAITVVKNDVRHSYNGKMHGVDTLTFKTYFQAKTEKYFTEDNRHDAETILKIKELLDTGKIW